MVARDNGKWDKVMEELIHPSNHNHLSLEEYRLVQADQIFRNDIWMAYHHHRMDRRLNVVDKITNTFPNISINNYFDVQLLSRTSMAMNSHILQKYHDLILIKNIFLFAFG